MQEKEKMLAGLIYDPADQELTELRQKAHRLSKEYNDRLETDEERVRLLDELLPNKGMNVYLQGPVQFDYGCFTTIGDNSYANFNFTCLDCCPVKIGSNVFMGPNVSLLTPVHPLRYQDRNIYERKDGVNTDKEYAKPITIGDNCWIGPIGTALLPKAVFGLFERFSTFSAVVFNAVLGIYLMKGRFASRV